MEDILSNVLRAFDGQRKELQAQLEDIDTKEKVVRDALSMDKRSIDRSHSVPDDKYDEILSYLRKHPGSRQADMAKALKLNSGIISSAMKIALDRRQAEVDRLGRGARYAPVDKKR